MDNRYNENEYENENKNAPKHKSRIWSVSALISAILSVALSWISLPIIPIAFGVLAIGLSILSRVKIGYFDGFGIASIIVAIFGIVFSFAFIILRSVIL